MHTVSLKERGSVLRSRRAVGLMAVAGALLSSGLVSQVQAAPRHSKAMAGRVSAAQAERIARRYVGEGAYVVRNEGVHDGAYRIHVHRGRVARHVFVGVRSGKVIKTRIINPRADRREDEPR